MRTRGDSPASGTGVSVSRSNCSQSPRSHERDASIRPGAAWETVDAGYQDIRFDLSAGIAKLTICRPEVRNAFRPTTLFELQDGFERARNDPEVGCIILTGEGPEAFCSGGRPAGPG